MTTPSRALKPVRIAVDPTVQSALAITRLATCTARRGDAECGGEFVQTALNPDGTFETAKAHPAEVDWEPKFCARCQRTFLHAEARAEAYAGNVGTLRHPATQGHPVTR